MEIEGLGVCSLLVLVWAIYRVLYRRDLWSIALSSAALMGFSVSVAMLLRGSVYGTTEFVAGFGVIGCVAIINGFFFVRECYRNLEWLAWPLLVMWSLLLALMIFSMTR